MTVLKIKLSADSPLNFDPAAADTRRRFTGTAHSGKPFKQYGTQFVADLDGIRLKPKTAVLSEHDPHRAAGVAVLGVVSGSLNAQGHLLDNEHGRVIAEAADGGFPWEMSVHIEARRYEELAAGASAGVNGHTVIGPAVIMRDCAVREVSFVAVGADADTSAVVLSDGKPFTLQPKEQSMTPEEKQKFDEMAAKLSQLEADKAKLEAEKHEAHIRAKLSAAGFKEDDKGGFEGVSAGSLKVLLSADPADAEALIGDWKLSAAKPPVPSALTQGLSDAPPAAPEQSVKLSAATATNAEGKHYV